MGLTSAPLRAVLFPAGSKTGTSQSILCVGQHSLAAWVTGVGTISAGTLVIEEADWDTEADLPYAGTWSSTDSIDCTAVSGGGQQKTIVPSSAPGVYAWRYVRARFSVDVSGSGGSVKVVLTGGV